MKSFVVEKNMKIKDCVKKKKKNGVFMRCFLLAFFCLVTLNHQLFSWTFNSNTAGTGVDTGTADTQVLTDSKFTVSAFDEERNILYLGEEALNKGSHSVVRVTFLNNAVQVQALGNVSTTAGQTNGTALVNKAIKKLQVLPNGDLLVHADNNALNSSATAPGTIGLIHVIQKPWDDANKQLVSLPVRVQDGDDNNSTFIKLAYAGPKANSTTVFRIIGVVSKGGRGDLAAGIGMTESDQRMRFYEYDSAAGITEVTALATQIKLTGGSVLQTAVGECSAGADNLSGFHWDDDLKALYFGVTINAKDTGAHDHCFLVMAKFGEDNPTPGTGVTFAPFLPQGNNDNVLCLQRINAGGVSIKNVKTLTTAAGKKYLVVQLSYNGETTVLNTPNSRSIYCFPIADDSGVAFADRGKGASVATTNVVSRGTIAATALATYATSNSESFGTVLPLAASVASDVRSLVGGNSAPAANFANILDMKMVADSVLIVCGGASAASVDGTARHGAWMSSPIYNAAGEINGWTPWARVFASGALSGQALGNISNLYVGTDGVVYFVAGNDAAAVVNQVGCQKWNNMNSNYFGTASNFVNKLKADFGTNNPIWFSKEFLSSAYDGGFGADGAKLAGITILGARNKVALISSARYATTFGVKNDSTDAENYKTFAVPVGSVLCAEMTRINDDAAAYATRGFIFVGGDNGLFVLRKNDGSGFDIRPDQAALGTLNTTFADFSFQRVPGINEAVFRLVATPNFLLVLTMTHLYRIRMDSLADPFNQALPTTALNMFASGILAQVEKNIDLSNLATTQNVTANKYNRNVLVVQKILSADSGEIFCDLVNIENTEATFLGSNVAGKGKIRGFNADAGIPSVVATLVLSAPLRKMYLRHLNHRNTALNNGYGHYITENNTGLFGGGSANNPHFGIIGNLIVVDGSVISKTSTMKYFVVNGSHYTDSRNTDVQRAVLSSQPSAAADDYFLKLLADRDVKNLGLVNDADFVGLPAVFGNKIAGSPLIKRILANGETSDWENSTVNSGFYSFAHARLENGQLMLLGHPFGISVFE